MQIQNVDFKIELEGIPVPFVSFNILEKVGQPAQAAVSFPAVEEFLYLLPKTKIQIYHKIGKIYYLIFDGALAGQGFNKTSLNRNIILNFTSNYMEWTRAYVENLSTNPDILKQQEFTVFTSKSLSVDGENLSSETFSMSNIPMAPVPTFEAILTDELNKTPNIDLNAVVQILLSKISDENPYYKLIDIAEQLSSRLFVADNPVGQNKLLSYDITKQLIGNKVASAGYLTPFSQILEKICFVLFYHWVDIAAVGYDGKNIYSTILKPNTEYFLPVQCNVFFPEQITSINYSRNMDAEPTRIILTASPLDFAGAGDPNSNIIHYYFTYPEVVSIPSPEGITKADTIKKYSTWTNEEKFRGVTVLRDDIANLVPIFFTADSKTEPDKAAGVKNWIQDTIDNATNPSKLTPENILKQSFTMRQYYTARYHSRTAQIATEYNPFRLVGFPALVIDQHLPSMYGEINSINTSISAEGNASQIIEIAAPKLCSKDAELVSFDKSSDDAIPNFASFFNDSQFGVAAIGKNLYHKVCGGKKDDYSLYGIAPGDDVVDVIKKATAVLKKQMLIGDDGPANHARYYAVNNRVLISEDDFKAKIGTKAHDHTKLTLDENGNLSEGSDNPIAKHPFVLARQDRVNKLKLIIGTDNLLTRNEQ